LIVADLSPHDVRRRLRGHGLRLRTGPVVNCVRSRVDAVAAGVALHYANHPVEADDGFADFHVAVERPRTLRRWLQPQVMFRFDDAAPFAPLPGDQGFPMLEWGLNWCMSSQCHRFLTLHAAVLERRDRALLLPAPSGSGKSTLCAGLAYGAGWRLLSDELALIAPSSAELVPLPRPVSLKNASIEAIRSFAPKATFGAAVHETVKGSIVHVKPPPESVRRADECVPVRWIVLPRYVPDAPAQLRPLSKARTFMTLVDNAFNYDLFGRRGFALLADIVAHSECFEFAYGDLRAAAAAFDALSADA